MSKYCNSLQLKFKEKKSGGILYNIWSIFEKICYIFIGFILKFIYLIKCIFSLDTNLAYGEYEFIFKYKHCDISELFIVLNPFNYTFFTSNNSTCIM